MNTNMKTEVRLLSVPLEKDNAHTFWFESKNIQEAYFWQKTMKHTFNCTYLRQDNAIRFPDHVDNLRCCNYVMYKNDGDVMGKWWYAFITKLEYVNDEVTKVYIETDVMQTWLFDYALQNSFVEREHVDDDTIGKHTYPEGLETGEYVTLLHETVDELEDLVLVVGVTALPDGTRVGGNSYNGIYSGIQYRYCTASKPNLMTNFIASYDDEGRANAIQNLFLAPAYLVEDDDNYEASSNSVVALGYTTVNEHNIEGAGRDNHFGVDDLTEQYYVPRNNKLFCYPFQYLLVSNGNGASAIYRYEDFDSSVRFSMRGVICPGGSIRLIPLHYKGDNEMDEEGLNLGKYPICNWQTDVYTNWLTQNSVNLAVSTVSNAATAITGALTLPFGGGSAMVSGITGIANTVGQVYAQSLQPPQAQGNLNCGDVVTASQNNTFHFYQMSIKLEYAKIVDEYFDMFGYKVCRVKTPNTNHRSNYWYTKTIDVNLTAGGVPQDDVQKIKDCYNRGITFWRKPELIKYYGTNPIV